MRQQSLILLHPTVKKIHLQENILFDLDLRVKVTRNVAQCSLHHVTYAPTEFEVTTSKALGVFVCYVALRPKSTAMVMAGWSVHLTTLFPGQA